MAKTPVSQDEVQLRKRARRRLVGAIALVLAAVVVLPMVLDGKPQQRPESINIDIPPIPAAAPGEGDVPPPHAAMPQSAAATAAPPAAPAAPTQPESAVANAEPAPPPPAPAAAQAQNTATPPSAESVVVQIGCFADAGKSRDLVRQIRAHKIPAFSEPAPGHEHACLRVRAGPFSSQDAARTARERLLKLKLIPPPSEGKIVRRGD